MLEMIEIYGDEGFTKTSRNDFVDFMHTALGRFGDPKEDIQRCINYAFSTSKGCGGFVIAAYHENKLIGGLIMNKTGMSGFIPDNILVYVAVDESTRGKGFGGEICKRGIEIAEGDVKLHVEYENPAKRLYERLGFTNKYAEMRFKK